MITNMKQLQWIENQYDTMKCILEKWVRINSWSENTSGLDLMLQTLSEDLDVLSPNNKKVIPLPPRTLVSKEGKAIQVSLGKALSLSKRPEAPFQVLLAGHMDTVYPPSNPFQFIDKSDDTHWRGPGVADMKGGLVIMLKALEAFEKSPLSHKLGWEVLITPDEEIGSTGSHDIYIEAAKRHRVGLVFEPSFADGALVSWRKGSTNLTLVVRGQSAHAGRDFHKGRSAIYAIASIIQEVSKLNDPSKGITVNIGHIEGGGPVNIVPDLAICRINIRSNTREEMASTKKNLQDIVKRPLEGIEIELSEDYARIPKPFDTKTEKLFSLVKECADSLNISFQLRESGGVCDGNILSEAGLPTFDSAGVVGGHLHTDKEYMYLPSLVERTKLVYLLLESLASG